MARAVRDVAMKRTFEIGHVAGHGNQIPMLRLY